MVLNAQIIDIILQISNHKLGPYWEKFKYLEDEKPELEIIFLPEQINRYGLERVEVSPSEKSIFRHDSEVMLVESNWKKVRIFNPIDEHQANTFLVQAFYTHAVQYHIIQVHSALIAASNNQGLMFLGPSGIGKTTQAELWN